MASGLLPRVYSPSPLPGGLLSWNPRQHRIDILAPSADGLVEWLLAAVAFLQ